MSVLTIGIIVKNEKENLPTCIDAIEPLRRAVSCTLAITDTGSTDGTDVIARDRADRFCRFAWNDDFSAARNTTLTGIDSEWYMYIDADEHCTDCTPLIEFFTTGEYKKYDSAAITIRNILHDNFENEFPAYRLVKVTPGMAFEGIIHETLNTKRNNTANINALFLHKGYSAGVIAAKELRNMTLLKKQIAQTTDPAKKARELFELAETLYRHLPDEAVKNWEESLSLSMREDINPVFKYCVLARLEMFYFVSGDPAKVIDTHKRYTELKKTEKSLSRIIYTDIEDAFYTALALAESANSAANAAENSPAPGEYDDITDKAFVEYFKLYDYYHANKDAFAADNNLYPAVNISAGSRDNAVHFFVSDLLRRKRFSDALLYLPNPRVSSADMLLCMDSADDFSRFESFAALPRSFETVKTYLSAAIRKIHLADTADEVSKKLRGDSYKGDFAAVSRYLQVPFDCQAESLDAKKSVIEFLNRTTNADELADLEILTADYIERVYRIVDPILFAPFIKTALETLENAKKVSN